MDSSYFLFKQLDNLVGYAFVEVHFLRCFCGARFPEKGSALWFWPGSL
jgi:hypothetical protein